MDENKQTNENLKYALCYVPLVAFILFYVEKNKTAILEKHVRYGMVIFGAYLILLILVSWLFKGLLGLFYVPLVAFILFYVEKKKTAILEKHVRYGMFIFGAYLILLILVSWLFKGLLGLFYVGVSVFMGYKTYIGEDIQIKFIDDFFDKSKSDKPVNSDKSDEL